MQTDSNGEKHCGNKDDCQGKDCGVGVCKDLVGDYTCMCPTGFYIGVKDGSKTCVNVRCEASTPELDNGQLLSAHTGAVDFPTTLRYKCDAGYSIDGTVVESARKFQSQCKADGQLFGMKLCQKITCGTPHVLPFTNLMTPSSPRKSIEYDDKATYKCADGYTLGGQPDARTNFEVKCKDNGVLTDPEVCEPVICGVAPHVPKSRPGISGRVFFGQDLVYRCDMGYTLDSTLAGGTQFQLHCQKDGKFSAIADQPCQPISAGSAPIVKNADLKEYAGKVVDRQDPPVFYPAGLEYRCKPGFSTTGSLSGPTKITVRVNSIGSFTPALPSECQKVSFSIHGRVKSAQNGQMLPNVKVTVQGTSNSVMSNSGFFTIEDVAGGPVTLVYEKGDFIKSTKDLVVTGNINSGGVADVSMSPTMRSDQWRAVLKWGESPSDLDTYGRWGWSKVWWGGMRRSASGETGVLEVDQTEGYGPETLYLSGVGRCRGPKSVCDFQYSINDYTESGNMLSAGDAEVTLYNGDRQAGSWKIKDCAPSVSSDRNWWKVFTIDSSTNKLTWNCKTGSLLQTSSKTDPARGLTQHSDPTTLSESTEGYQDDDTVGIDDNAKSWVAPDLLEASEPEKTEVAVVVLPMPAAAKAAAQKLVANAAVKQVESTFKFGATSLPKTGLRVKRALAN